MASPATPPPGSTEPAGDDALLFAPDAEDPRDADAPLLHGHTYDGIREYDNPMPGWWVGIFVLTVIWAPIYVLGVHVFGFINTYEEDLGAAQAELEADRAAFAASGPAFRTDPRSLEDFAADAANQQAGAAAFAATCAACHGEQGQGLIGPNLTDDRWLHGGAAEDVYRVVTEGAPTAGMPPWGAQFSDEERGQLVAYVRSLRGTNPPGAKPPQGEPYVGP